jgi:hypothetical protein
VNHRQHRHQDIKVGSRSGTCAADCTRRPGKRQKGTEQAVSRHPPAGLDKELSHEISCELLLSKSSSRNPYDFLDEHNWKQEIPKICWVRHFPYQQTLRNFAVYLWKEESESGNPYTNTNCTINTNFTGFDILTISFNFVLTKMAQSFMHRGVSGTGAITQKQFIARFAA